jgi:hypothetical protein
MKNRKNKVTNILKIGVFLFGISLLLLNCEKDIEIHEPISEHHFAQNFVSFDQIPKVKSFYEGKIKSAYTSKTNTSDNYFFDEEKVLEIIDTLQNKNYSISFTRPNDKEGVFYNLVIGKNAQGEIQTPFVLKFKPDIDNSEEFIKNNFDFTYFNGSISRHKYTDFFDLGYFSKGDTKCEPLIVNGDPVPCDDTEVNNSGTRGDGSGGNNGNSGGAGGGGWTYSSCSYSVGTNGPCRAGGTAAHPPSRCGAGTGVQVVITIECNDIEMKTQAKRKSDDCPPCSQEVNGGIGVNSSTQYVNTLISKLRLKNNTDAINFLNNNSFITFSIYNFLNSNNNSPEATNFVKEEVIKLSNYSSNDYPGMNDNLPFEWWKNDNLINTHSFFNQDPYDVWRTLTKKEKEIFKLYPALAIIMNRNKRIAEQTTIQRYGNNGLNDNSDAFRHAYFNAINARDMGKYAAKLLSDAHESETPTRWALEVQMDLFNNNIGHEAGHNFDHYNDTQMSNLIFNKIMNGDGRYLHPINTSDPNFRDDPSTPEQNDGTHGITTSTILKPTY